MTKEKSQAELQIEALADVFNTATTGFEEFYKEAKEKGSSAASSGYYSKASCDGENSSCTAIGYRAAVRGDKGNLIMASEYVIKDNKYVPVSGKANIIDGKKLKPNCWYIVENAEWVQVDFTDGVFSYVLSNRAGVKKVKTERGLILYVVSDDKGNSAHGETIKQAREDLIYKIVANSDVEIPKKATGKEWVAIYRAVTGACSSGVKHFVEITTQRNGGTLEDTYTREQIIKLTENWYGAEKFRIKSSEA